MKNKIHHDDQNFLDLLSRWLRGDFRRADEKSVQKLTADDDFRHEAMQGFSEFSKVNHAEKLAVLRQQLAEKTGAAPQFRVVWRQRLLAAAAIFVFVLGTVWLFQKQDILPEKTVADLPQSAENQSIEKSMPQNSDAKIFTENSPATANQDPLADEKTAAKPAPKPQDFRVESENEKTFGSASKSASDDRDVSFSSPKIETPTNETAAEMKDEISSVRATEVAPQPVFEEKKAKENASDFAKKKMPAASKQVSPSKSAPAGQIKHDTDSKPDLEKLRKIDDLPAAAEPVGGWDAFHEYIRQNARLAADAAKQMNFGIVSLQFFPQPNGEPGPILITKSLGFGLDDEAKRLVQFFDWQMGKNNLVKLDIRFVR